MWRRARNVIGPQIGSIYNPDQKRISEICGAKIVYISRQFVFLHGSQKLMVLYKTLRAHIEHVTCSSTC
jgi:hypothetical protein